MLIDWFTVMAQVVNFLVLVWLMKRFLYSPVISAIDAREKRIAAELAAAQAKRSEAQRECDMFSRNNEEIAQARASLLAQATAEAQAERQRLLAEARQEFDDLKARQEEALQKDYAGLKDEIIRRSQDEVMAIARQTLDDLATASLESQMVEAFIRRCRCLPNDELAALQRAFLAAQGPALVHSRFPLPAQQRDALQRVVAEVFAFEGRFYFETLPEMVCGLELRIDGHQVGWNIDEYLRGLEKTYAEILTGQS